MNRRLLRRLRATVGLACFLACLGVQPVAAQQGDLEELLEPALEDSPAPVRRQLSEQWAALEAKLEAGTPPGELAAGFGELGRHYLAYELYQAAEPCFFNARRLDPQKDRWAYLLGYVYQQQGKLDAAAGAYKELLEPDPEPEDLTVLLRLGALYLDLGQPKAAEKLFEVATDRAYGRWSETAPEMAAAYYGAGRAALELGDAARALTYFAEALEHEPEATRIHYQRALAFRALGRMEEARREMSLQGPRHVSFPDPELATLGALRRDVAPLLEAAEAALAENRPAEAVALARRAAEADPKSPEALATLGQALVMTGDPTALGEAKESFLEMLELSPGDPRSHYRLGVLLAAEGSAAEAERHLRSSLATDPSFAEANLALARLLLTAERAEEALPLLNRVQSAPGGSGEAARRLRIEALARQGRWTEALEHLEALAAREEIPGPAYGALLRGLERSAAELAGSGDLEGAERSLGRLLELEPEDPETRYRAALAWLTGGQGRRALEVLRRAVERFPASGTLLHSLAQLEATLPGGDRIRALEAATAVFRSQQSAEHAETLAAALAGGGHLQEAVELQSQLVAAREAEARQAPSPQADQRLARARRNLERYRAGEPSPEPWLGDG